MSCPITVVSPQFEDVPELTKADARVCHLHGRMELAAALVLQLNGPQGGSGAVTERSKVDFLLGQRQFGGG